MSSKLLPQPRSVARIFGASATNVQASVEEKLSGKSKHYHLDLQENLTGPVDGTVLTICADGQKFVGISLKNPSTDILYNIKTVP